MWHVDVESRNLRELGDPPWLVTHAVLTASHGHPVTVVSGRLAEVVTLAAAWIQRNDHRDGEQPVWLDAFRRHGSSDLPVRC